MTTCYAPGAIRAYLDGELPSDELSAVEQHLTTCVHCAASVSDLRDLDERVAVALRFAGATSPGADADADASAAYARLRSRLGAEAEARPTHGSRVPVRLRPVRSVRSIRPRRATYTAAAIAAALLVVLLVPPLRTVADNALSVFRGQKTVFVSVPDSRVRQLENLKVDPNTLFLSKPGEVGTAPAPHAVGSPAEAAPALGYTPAVPTAFPSAPVSTTYSVMGQTAYTAQVNVQTLRAVLTSLGVTDVTIPDALGARPISIVLPPMVQEQYQGKDYAATLIEGTSPIVNLPDGVDLSQLGRAVLEVDGMSPSDAATVSKRIDWRSTLVFPFPLGTNVLEQVNINGSQGVLLTVGGDTGLIGTSSKQAGSTQGESPATGSTKLHTLIYWQQGTRFYILDAQGALSRYQVIALAGSVR